MPQRYSLNLRCHKFPVAYKIDRISLSIWGHDPALVGPVTLSHRQQAAWHKFQQTNGAMEDWVLVGRWTMSAVIGTSSGDIWRTSLQSMNPDFRNSNMEVVSSIPAGSTIIYRFLCGFICVSLCQSIKIKPTNMYIASARAQFKINTHMCWNWHLCIPDGLSVVQCSLGHVIGVAFIDAISVAWSVRAGQLAAGGVASVWRSWVRSPPGPR